MFGIFNRSRKDKLEELRGKIRVIHYQQVLLCKRMSYLESRNPEEFKHLNSKDNPVVRLRQSEKDKIDEKIDQWLSGLE